MSSFSEHLKNKNKFDKNTVHHIGIFEGEGVGQELIPLTVKLLETLKNNSKRKIQLSYGDEIGSLAKKKYGVSLTQSNIDFIKSIFKKKGAVFCGPGGERFVYKLRKKFNLFCKFTPLQPFPSIHSAGTVKKEATDNVDIIAVRENMGGVYQGTTTSKITKKDGLTICHRFSYSEKQVTDIIEVAAKLAKKRLKLLHLVTKPGGVDGISQLWFNVAKKICAKEKVKLIHLEIDNSVYQLIANPKQFNVIVSPNMMGDILADCGSLLLRSRGLSYSCNFDQKGNGVYQTGHGAAYDIAGKNIVNPIGQFLSLGAMLKESFSWPMADELITQSIKMTLDQGFRTFDIHSKNSKKVSTTEFTKQTIKNLLLLINKSDKKSARSFYNS